MKVFRQLLNIKANLLFGWSRDVLTSEKIPPTVVLRLRNGAEILVYYSTTMARTRQPVIKKEPYYCHICKKDQSYRNKSRHSIKHRFCLGCMQLVHGKHSCLIPINRLRLYPVYNENKEVQFFVVGLPVPEDLQYFDAPFAIAPLIPTTSNQILTTRSNQRTTNPANTEPNTTSSETDADQRNRAQADLDEMMRLLESTPVDHSPQLEMEIDSGQAQATSVNFDMAAVDSALDSFDTEMTPAPEMQVNVQSHTANKYYSYDSVSAAEFLRDYFIPEANYLDTSAFM